MIIKNKDLLKRGQAPKRCELCKRGFGLQPHHIYLRGAGGGRRLDVPINIIWICQFCHDGAHGVNADETRQACLAEVAMREGCEPGDIAAVIEAVIRLPKSPTDENCRDEAVELPTDKAVGLFTEIMAELRKRRFY